MLTAIILAAGKGTRMCSRIPKVLFTVAGRPMIDYVIDAALGVGVEKIVTVVGYGAEEVVAHIGDIKEITIAHQEHQNGTGDAIKTALPYINDNDTVLILCGDVPLITSTSLSAFIQNAHKNVNLISVRLNNPTGYGRIVRGNNGNILKIVEEKDATEEEKKITEVNASIYYCHAFELKRRIQKISNNNAQNEYYLTDIIEPGDSVYTAPYPFEYLGVNDRKQLSIASHFLWEKRADHFMRNGVSILSPSTFCCDYNVEIGKDTGIYPNVILEDGTKIGNNCVIRQGVRIKHSIIEDQCEIKDHSLIEDSFVGKASSVGPMAHLRPGSHLAGDNKVGNFVETKKTHLGLGSKASHLTYLGDAEVGNNVNIGCGTITCNYDGYNKSKTVIGDNVFVGSDTQLVAPVSVGEGAVLAAGSTITKDVPSAALAISRAHQHNLEGRGKDIMEQNKLKKEQK